VADAPETTTAPSSPPPPPPLPPERGVFDLLKEAYELYRANTRVLLTICAVVFVPASIVKSCAYAAVTRSTVAAEVTVEDISKLKTDDLQATQRALQEAYSQHADAKTIAKLEADQARLIQEIGTRTVAATSAAMGSFMAFVLGILGTLITTFFVYGIVVPLTNGAITIFVAHRKLDRDIGWQATWTLVARRFVPLLTAVIPAACLIAFGFVFFVLPGFVLGLLFAFIAPAVLLESKRGRAALQRSVELVGTEWLRVALMVVVLGVLNWAANIVVAIFIPRTALFVGAVLSDLVTLVFLPLPMIAMVLLYFDVRRKRDGLSDERLGADLDALKAV
jgi:hypothetical protein